MASTPRNSGGQPGDGAHLETLLDTGHAQAYPLSDALLRRHGGPFGLPASCLYSNFVASVDGVVALGPDHPQSGSVISGHSEADRFLMGLLRASADAVLIGAGTLRATPQHQWTAEHVFPAAAEDFHDLRHRIGRSARPRLYVVTASGDVDVAHPALRTQATIITTARGAEKLRGRLPADAVVCALDGDPDLPMEAVLALIHADGHQVVLTEGGPSLMGRLLRAKLLDEMFLTIAPRAFGRTTSQHRAGMIESVSFTPDQAPVLVLLSVHRADDLTFLRYACPR